MKKPSDACMEDVARTGCWEATGAGRPARLLTSSRDFHNRKSQMIYFFINNFRAGVGGDDRMAGPRRHATPRGVQPQKMLLVLR